MFRKLLIAMLLAWPSLAYSQIVIRVSSSTHEPGESTASLAELADIVDFSRFGEANDDNFENEDAVVTAVDQREGNERLVLYFPGGDWNFEDIIPVNTHGNPSSFENVVFVGAPRAQTGQLQAETGRTAATRRTRFMLNMDSEDDIWWNMIRASTVGGIYFQDIDFCVVDKGSVMSFGDFTNNTDSFVAVRGLGLVNLFFDRVKHYGAADIGDGRPWLINTGANGHVLNRTNNSFAVRMSHVYDAYLDVKVRGFKYGVINRMPDMTEGKIRGITNGITLLEYGIAGGTAPVASQWSRVVAEAPLLAGVVTNGSISNFRGETYAGSYSPAPGPFLLPATASWTIAVGADHAVFTWGGAFDARDYFEPWLFYYFDPTTADEPTRLLQCTSVTASQVFFADSTSGQHVPRALAGLGSGVTQLFGVPYNGYGDRAAVTIRSTGVTSINVPKAIVRPEKTPIPIAGDTNGRDADATSEQAIEIARATAGAQSNLHGGVDLIGSGGQTTHPLANPGGIGPRFNQNYREAIWNPHTRTQLFIPGRGVGYVSDNAKQLTFHTVVDTETGESVYCYRLSDDPDVGWQLRKLRKSNVEADLTIRVYVPTGSGTLNVYGGEGGANQLTCVTGWSTKTTTLGTSQIADDATGPYLQLSGSGIYVAYVIVDQNNMLWLWIFIWLPAKKRASHAI